MKLDRLTAIAALLASLACGLPSGRPENPGTVVAALPTTPATAAPALNLPPAQIPAATTPTFAAGDTSLPASSAGPGTAASAGIVTLTSTRVPSSMTRAGVITSTPAAIGGPATVAATPTATLTTTSTTVPTSAPTSITPTFPPPTPTPTLAPPSPTTAATPAPTAAGACQTAGSESFENQLIALINQERSNRGIALLTAQAQLAAAARSHSADMACNGFFSHAGSNGSSPFDRMLQAGYVFSAAAENIAAGYGSPQEAFDGWMSSQGHRDNMLNPAYIHVGIGYVFVDGSQFGSYWTAIFGSP